MAGRTNPAEWGDIPAIITDQAKAFFGTMMFYVPSSDEAYEAALQQFQEQFLYHFYQREIGSETIGQFKLWLRSKFITIMPYYEQLYKTTLIKYNITDTVDMYREIRGEDNSEKARNEKTLTSAQGEDTTNSKSYNASEVKDNTSSSGDTVNKFSDTPQGSLMSVEAGNYLTNATIEDRNENTESKTESKGGNESISRNEKQESENRVFSGGEKENKNTTTNEHWHGKEGGVTYAELIKQAREAIININKMIIDECEPLFMQVF